MSLPSTTTFLSYGLKDGTLIATLVDTLRNLTLYIFGRTIIPKKSDQKIITGILK